MMPLPNIVFKFTTSVQNQKVQQPAPVPTLNFNRTQLNLHKICQTNLHYRCSKAYFKSTKIEMGYKWETHFFRFFDGEVSLKSFDFNRAVE